jgi:outer membrane lipoprotein SlyB
MRNERRSIKLKMEFGIIPVKNFKNGVKLMNAKYINIVATVSLALVATGCARQISPNVYKASAVGEVSHTYRGVIINARQVQVEQGESLEDNATGIGLGAIAGGLVGSQIGSGTSSLIAGTALGAIAGGVGGAFVEKNLKSQDGMEYTVQLNNGQIVTVVQGMDVIYTVGQPVFVISSTDGRSRVVPDNNPHVGNAPSGQVVMQQVATHPISAQAVAPQAAPQQQVAYTTPAGMQVVYVQAPAPQERIPQAQVVKVKRN